MRNRKQNPSCDGVNTNRLLFSIYTKTGSVPFISGQKGNDGKIILNAGQAQGIWKDAPFAIHATLNPSLEANPQLLDMYATGVMEAKSVLSLRQSHASHVPNQFFARLLEYQTNRPLYVYCKAKLPDLSAIGITSSQTSDNADIIISFEGHLVSYTMRVRTADFGALGIQLGSNNVRVLSYLPTHTYSEW